MKKAISFIFIMFLIISLLGCSKKPEIRIDINVLDNYLPDIPVENGYWCGGEIDNIFSGIGPSKYYIYGVFTLKEEYLTKIDDEYTWAEVEDNYILDKLDIQDMELKDSIYYYSDEFTIDMKYLIKADMYFDFDNNRMLFYGEYAFN